MKRHIRGITTIECAGDNIYKFINEIRDRGIVCTSQQCRNGIFSADIRSHDAKKINEIGEKHGIEINPVSRRGLIYKIMPYRFRIGIIAGIIFVLAFVFYFSNTVVTIDVYGNTEVTKAQILTALNDMGISRGTFIPSVDFHSCEQQLRLSIPEIAWTGIRHTGSRLIVDITEAVKPPEPVNDDIPCNIVASRDAQLTYAEVYAGRLVKKKGDGVKKGDIIISGTVNDGGGHFLKKHAMGHVRGIYTETTVFSQPYKQSGQVYSETENRKYLDFFGLRIPLFISGVDSVSYDYSESTSQFSFFGTDIPIGLVRCRYEPFVYAEKEYTKEEAEILLEQQTALYQKNFYDSKGIEVLNRTIKKKEDENGMEFIVTYRLEGDIGLDKEIYVDR